MRQCHVIEIVTPKKFILRGLWFGPQKSKRTIVFVHGLRGSAFSMLSIAEKLADRGTAVLTFSNRGNGIVNQVSSTKKGGKSLVAGSAHEVFTDCVDDIQGAINFAKKQGAKNVYLAGHSTGCQKSIYWASKYGKGVRGIILLAPVSDYAGAIKNHGKKKVAKATAYARELVRRGKKHELVPLSVWPEELDDAQRLISLYSPDSVEEIFTYAQPDKTPRTLKSVKVPIFALWAGKEQYADRKPGAIKAWFEEHLAGRDFKFVTIPNVKHGFKGGERYVAEAIRKWATVQ
ncbi:alpha/beta fold hydrolase [Candidatus Kaiserbacteria bacterium]|nr:alpha/beta fold hydrolase [Candidatus Kaiserbacteria bacterium]